MYKEEIKKNKNLYNLLKPFVDIGRIIKYTLCSFFKMHLCAKSNNAKSLRKFKNKYRNQRCYIVSNGPSLTIEDLELIKREISFGCNRIFSLFNETQWRPSIWCVSDENIIDGVS